MPGPGLPPAAMTRTRAESRFFSPWATAACMIVLGWSGWTLDPTFSEVGRRWSGTRAPKPEALSRLITRDPGGAYTLHDLDADSADAMVRAVASGHAAWEVSASWARGPRGWWALTRHADDLMLVVIEVGTGAALSRDDAASVIAASLGAGGAGYPPGWSARLTAGPGEHGSSIPAGYLKNAATLAAAVTLPWTLVWVPRRVSEGRAARRRTRGRCVACGHDLAGLARCPECGGVQ
ncbi:MAG: hypothetical protein HRU70_05385 [Phycisphaeraceae bacterium]|nr:MAG: hypothetical protein HRU70_05385 [Phycisphaeraceae bacterium]